MSLKAGRVGVAPDQVDEFGKIKSEATSGYTKQEADAKFSTKDELRLAINDIDLLMASKLTDVYNVMGENGVKNLLPIKIETVKAKNTSGTWTNNSYTVGNTTFACTVNSGYVTAIDVSTSGAADASRSFIIFAVDEQYSFIGENVILNGCPSNGSASSYYLDGYRLATQDGSGGSVRDVGEGIQFDFLNNGSGTKGEISIVVVNGTNISTPKTFKPMLRDARDTNPTYQPYALTNMELTGEKLDISTLKAISADAADFAAFKTAIANL